MLLRNECPRPWFSDAPAMRPGLSAILNLIASLTSPFLPLWRSLDVPCCIGSTARSRSTLESSITRPSCTSSCPSSQTRTIPTCGLRVVKAYDATSALAFVNALRSVDFPAFGNPTSPTSATIFSSSSRVTSSASWPRVAHLGDLLPV